MAFEMSRHGDGRTIIVAGELDIDTRDQLEAGFAKLALADEDVRMDLSGVTFIDSTGLGALVGLTRRMSGVSQIILVDPSEAVTRLLALTGVDEMGVFRIEARDFQGAG
jgi:anti-anti-sigma factor